MRRLCVRPGTTSVAAALVRRRALHASSSLRDAGTSTSGNETSSTGGASISVAGIDTSIAGGGAGAKGRTGGGPALGSTAPGAPPPPKVLNSSVAGGSDGQVPDLSPEQRREVEEHNRAFERRHDRGCAAPEYEVDDKFWTRGPGPSSSSSSKP